VWGLGEVRESAVVNREKAAAHRKKAELKYLPALPPRWPAIFVRLNAHLAHLAIDSRSKCLQGELPVIACLDRFFNPWWFPSAYKPAKSREVFTWALATGSLYSRGLS
jgi:hypothetical protein